MLGRYGLGAAISETGEVIGVQLPSSGKIPIVQPDLPPMSAEEFNALAWEKASDMSSYFEGKGGIAPPPENFLEQAKNELRHMLEMGGREIESDSVGASASSAAPMSTKAKVGIGAAIAGGLLILSKVL